MDHAPLPLLTKIDQDARQAPDKLAVDTWEKLLATGDLGLLKTV